MPDLIVLMCLVAGLALGRLMHGREFPKTPPALQCSAAASRDQLPAWPHPIPILSKRRAAFKAARRTTNDIRCKENRGPGKRNRVRNRFRAGTLRR